jgi:cell division cycle 20, cofactor of APC complex
VGLCGDRFIPSRGATNFEIGNYLIKKEEQKKETDGAGCSKDENNAHGSSSDEKVKVISEAIHGMDISKKRILAFQNKAPAPPESHLNPLRVVYSVKTPSSTKSGTRYIPTNPERILDAPDIVNDYYLNLLDWSRDNIVTVALGQSVYLWNAGTGNIEILFQNQGDDQSCSLAWIQEGSILAVGNSNGSVELWDCNKMRRLRVMTGHEARVGSLAWNSYLVSSGSRDGSIIHHDVRQREHKVMTLNGHSQEVCGLKWSPDSKYLASGGNDNLVNIWDAAGNGSLTTGNAPLHSFGEHQAAVRALAWCPWQSSTLASGGGTADRSIKFWNVNTGTCINSVDTKSQVCALLFSEQYKELMSGHGYANHQLTIWKYPSMAKQIDLTGHTQRVLQLAVSPDGSTVMSAGADETLRLWKCFAPDPSVSKKKIVSNDKTSFLLKQSIR